MQNGGNDATGEPILSNESSSDNPAQPSEPRRPFVTIMIGAASLLFLLAAAMLYYRSITMNEPGCVIVIEASQPWKDAEINVDGGVLMKPLKATIGKQGRYAIPFYVDAGEYTVTVTVNGDAKHQATVVVNEAVRGWRLDLSKLDPTTMPTIQTSDGPP
jgi:hypothetical protein